MARPNCCFLSNIYFLNISTINEFEDFVRTYKRTDMTGRLWQGCRRKRRTALMKVKWKASSNFTTKEQYLKHFSLQTFAMLTEQEKSLHTLKDCAPCLMHHEPGHLVLPTTSSTPSMMARAKLKSLVDTTPPSEWPNNARQLVTQVLSETPQRAIGMRKRKVDDLALVSKPCQRKILKTSRDNLKDLQASTEFVALFASKQSMKEWDSQRRDSHGCSRENLKKTHTGSLEQYDYNFDLLYKQIDGNEDCLEMLNFSQLAREIMLVDRKGVSPKNGGQVRNNFVVMTIIMKYQINMSTIVNSHF